MELPCKLPPGQLNFPQKQPVKTQGVHWDWCLAEPTRYPATRASRRPRHQGSQWQLPHHSTLKFSLALSSLPSLLFQSGPPPFLSTIPTRHSPTPRPLGATRYFPRHNETSRTLVADFISSFTSPPTPTSSTRRRSRRDERLRHAIPLDLRPSNPESDYATRPKAETQNPWSKCLPRQLPRRR